MKVNNEKIEAARAWVMPVRIVLIACLLFLYNLDCRSQESVRQLDYASFGTRIWESKVFYFKSGDTLLMKEYKSNSFMLAVLDSMLSHPRLQGHIDSVYVKSVASPAGSFALNKRLSVGRGESLKTYIMWKHPGFTRERIVVEPEGIDWAGFCAILEKSPDFPNKEKLLSLPYQTASDDDLLAQIQSVSGPQTHRYLVNNIFPYLQYASLTVLLNTGQTIPLSGNSALALLVESGTKFAPPVLVAEEFAAESEKAEVAGLDSEYNVAELAGADSLNSGLVPLLPCPDKISSYGLKTNLLYWATGTPNIGFDFLLSGKWSGELWGGYQPWKLGDGSLRHWLAGAGVNYWAREVHNGHFFGAHLLYSEYNVGKIAFIPAFDEHTYQGSLYGAGLSYGYNLPLSRNWGLEFSVGIGYLHMDYIEYRHVNRFEIMGRKSENRFMPDKVGISLVYTLK